MISCLLGVLALPLEGSSGLLVEFAGRLDIGVRHIPCYFNGRDEGISDHQSWKVSLYASFLVFRTMLLLDWALYLWVTVKPCPPYCYPFRLFQAPVYINTMKFHCPCLFHCITKYVHPRAHCRLTDSYAKSRACQAVDSRSINSPSSGHCPVQP